MTEEFKQKVIDALRRGEELPREWARDLFPSEKYEYELVYHGKEREEEIIANAMAVPLQAVRTFGNNGCDWHNMLIFGDNLQVMKTLLEQKNNGTLCNSDGTPGVRLIYIDPPFATKKDYSGSQEQKAYTDKIAGSQFIEFLRKRLVLLRELLSDDGSIFVHLDTKKSHYIKTILDEIFGEDKFQNELIWKRSSAHSDSDTFANLHDTIFFYSNNSEFYFKPQFQKYSEDYIEERYKHIEGKRRYLDRDLSAKGLTGGGYSYTWKGVTQDWRCPIETMRRYQKEERLYYTKNGVARYKQYLDEMPGVALQDIWLDINAVNSQAIERVDYPTQKPESLLNRIITAGSKPGDIVVDAFAGSGTTCAVAEKLGRRWVAIDCGKLSIYTIQKRMLSLRAEIGNKGKTHIVKPFTLYNAGLYDFSSLKALPWNDWRFFALQLFGCKDEPHSIGGLKLDGKLKGSSVFIFNHIEQPGRRIDEETIQDIHLAVGKRIGRKFFIIAPRGVFDFQQDYIDLDGIRYYALRIPYSVINELHHRDFKALQQPNDESAVNDTVDVVGFDFIQTPQVKWDVSIKKRKGELFDEACLKITNFESRARIRGEDTRGGFETFSMLMLDYDYDGKVFDLDAVYFANQLQLCDRQAWFPTENLGDKFMAVFVDIYGNEAREVITLQKQSISTKKSSKSKKKARK